ncbi:Hypothetical predicted protein [Podarcis lilfordi]|uniref:Uncharacterized protein n=1 Tax=Podarcis lilfordi TaxID=74358 RepID=A0AA35LCH4_9SAUR|nr:Hypothetical predicted protein [Podarcis lilfordi]
MFVCTDRPAQPTLAGVSLVLSPAPSPGFSACCLLLRRARRAHTKRHRVLAKGLDAGIQARFSRLCSRAARSGCVGRRRSGEAQRARGAEAAALLPRRLVAGGKRQGCSCALGSARPLLLLIQPTELLPPRHREGLAGDGSNSSCPGATEPN